MEIVLELNAFPLLWIPHNVCSEITDVFKSQSERSKTECEWKKVCCVYTNNETSGCVERK